LLGRGATGYHGFTYYRTEVKARCLSPVSWQKIAFLKWPDSDNWNDGEIDYPEGSLNGNMGGFNHWPGSPSSQDSYSSSTNLSTWHTYAVEWTAGRLVFILDGVIVKTMTSHVPSTPFHDVLQCERVLKLDPIAGSLAKLCARD
jgi:beta-glucanase (GH16 family)